MLRGGVRTVRETITELPSGEPTVSHSTHVVPVVEEITTEVGFLSTDNW